MPGEDGNGGNGGIGGIPLPNPTPPYQPPPNATLFHNAVEHGIEEEDLERKARLEAVLKLLIDRKNQQTNNREHHQPRPIQGKIQEFSIAILGCWPSFCLKPSHSL